MKFTRINKNYIVRIEKGDLVIESLTVFCKKENIKSAFLTGLGAFKSAEIGFYHLDRKEYTWQTFENPMEVVSLTGNVSLVDGEPFIHIHVVISDSSFQAYGGHLKEAVVGATLELFVKPLEKEIGRKFDEKIGLKLLDLEQ